MRTLRTRLVTLYSGLVTFTAALAMVGGFHLMKRQVLTRMDESLEVQFATIKDLLKDFGTFHETAKVVNSLFGETWRIVEFGSTNCQLEFERCWSQDLQLYL